MRSNIKSLLSFTGTKFWNGALWKRKPQGDSELPVNIFQNCSSLTMDRFIRCLIDKEYSALIISGKASDEDLLNAWANILGEYHELKGDTIDAIAQLSLIRDINKLRTHLVLVEYCISFLADRYSVVIASCLLKLGYVFAPDDQDPAKYFPILEGIINQSKTKYIQLQQLLEQLNGEQIKEQRAITANDFQEALIEIEEMQKISYDFQVLTVSKFILLERKLMRRIETLKNRANGTGKD